MLLCMLYAMFYVYQSECVIVVGYSVNGSSQPRPLTYVKGGQLKMN